METIIRPATMDDAKRVWEIRNDPAVRRNSSNQDVIQLENHLGWFENKYFNQEGNFCFVLELGSEVIGYCRYDQDDAGNLVVSIALDSIYHGRGLGFLLLARTIEHLPMGGRILATVLKNNPASFRIFEKQGFETINEDGQSFHMQKEI